MNNKRLQYRYDRIFLVSGMATVTIAMVLIAFMAPNVTMKFVALIALLFVMWELYRIGNDL